MGRGSAIVEGQRFGHLTVIGQAEERTTDNKIKWICKCVCGTETVVRSTHLRQGKIKSCGCYRVESAKKTSTTHGMSATRTYKIWEAILRRCTNPNALHYKDYGGRGISVSDSWMHFENFLSDMGLCPKGMQIDRINNELGYFKGNCRWTTAKENANNKRNNVVLTMNGKSMTVAEWSEELGINRYTIYGRLSRGKTTAEALSPVI